MRIAVAQFMHETVTFLQADTTREDFIYEGSPLGGEALLQSSKTSYMGGFVKVAREFADVELLGITSPMFPRTGIGSGWITADAFEWFVGDMLGQLADAGPLDGVFLALHGSMAVRGIARPEAELARHIRQCIGPRPFIAATFDPHGNEDEAFLQSADLAFCAKYFPHYDEYLQGARAARMLVRAIRGDYRPAHATCEVPILTPTVMQCTDSGPWAELVQRALVWEARCPDLYVNVFFGFPWNDSVDAGMTVQATANGDSALAQRAVNDLAGHAWRLRAQLVRSAEVFELGPGMRQARQLMASGPVIVADHSDRSGRATWVLAEILAQGLPRALVATVADRDVVRQIVESNGQPGDAFDMHVGGGPDESDGPAVRVRGTIRSIVSMRHVPGYEGNSPWIVVELDSSSVLVISPFLAQILDPAVLSEHLGLDPPGFQLIALKSRVHFRRGFVDSGLIANVVIVEPAQPFLGTVRLDHLPYRHLTLRDFYPYGRDTFVPNVVVGGR